MHYNTCLTLYGMNCFYELLLSGILTYSLLISIYIYKEQLWIFPHFIEVDFNNIYLCVDILYLYSRNNGICDSDATLIEGLTLLISDAHRAYFHQADWRRMARSREVSKLRDSRLDFSGRPTSPRCLSNFGAIRSL